jgi:hypothetical protein
MASSSAWMITGDGWSKYINQDLSSDEKGIGIVQVYRSSGEGGKPVDFEQHHYPVTGSIDEMLPMTHNGGDFLSCIFSSGTAGITCGRDSES